MKRRTKVLVFAVGIALFAVQYSDSNALSLLKADNVAVVQTFGVSPDTGRSFSWHLPNDGTVSAIEYCLKNGNQEFDASQSVKVPAKQFVTKTDKGDRQICKVSITGLMPDNEYMYRVVTDKGVISSVGSFKTAPSKTEAFGFINITDTQGCTAQHYEVWGQTLRGAMDKFPNDRFLVHCGDMVDKGDEILFWDNFISASKNELLKMPIAPAMGNHDTLNKNITNPKGKNFNERFDLPVNSEFDSYSGTIYSFNYSNAHFIILNSETNSQTLEKQKAWVKADILKAKKQWNIVALHRPLYGSNSDNKWLRNALGPVFDEMGVDLVLQGHDHSYARTFSMYNKKAQPSGKGTVYTVANTGAVKFYNTKKQSWNAVNIQPKKAMYISVGINQNRMWIGALDNTNKLLDSTTITK